MESIHCSWILWKDTSFHMEIIQILSREKWSDKVIARKYWQLNRKMDMPLQRQVGREFMIKNS